jgi:hypothetical protein
MLNPEKIHFTFFAQAYYVDMEWGFGCPSGGIKNIGELCHKYKIPVTWLVSPKSARCEQEMLTEYHEKYGDEVALFFRFNQLHHSNERTRAQSMTVEEYREEIQKQTLAIQKALPWAELKVAGQGIRTINLLKALQAEGFIGMFGHCPYQIGTDSITDYGMPWGSFPTDPEDIHRPAKASQTGLITFEWTARDLTRSFHTARPELWSTDPNDVERGGVCTDTNVEYWKELFMQYERALPLNEGGIWFQFHQEAHEQTWGEICKPMNEERVKYCTSMMDTFLQWLVTRPNVEFTTATPTAQYYLAQTASGTLPRYHPSKWTPVEKQLPFWDQVRHVKGYSGNIHKCAMLPVENLFEYLMKVNARDYVKAMESPPWMDTFFFYDAECQLVFDLGLTAPVAIYNYLNYEPDPEFLDMAEEGGGIPGFYLEPEIPIPEIMTISEKSIKITVLNPLKKTFPYGIFLWNEQYPQAMKTFSSIQVPKEYNFKISPDQGVFIRLNLAPGKNEFTIQGK